MATNRALPRLLTSALAVAGLVATAAVTFGAVPSATAAARIQVGVQFHGLWSDYTDADRAVVLDSLAAAGAGWVRLDMSWAMLQPQSRTEWSSDGLAYVDHVVDMAAARGLKVLATFWLTPGWANGGQGERVLPTDPADYARAAQVVAARWATKVRAWEVWNEPNSPDFLTGADPVAYAALLRAAYPALHAGDPTTTVVSGGTSYVDDIWLARAYAAGIGGSFDVLAVHPYPGIADEPPDLPDNGTIWRPAHVAAVRSLMVANGDSAKPIWFTEVGWSTHDNTGLDFSDPATNWQRGVTPAQQADYLTRLLDFASALPYVTAVFWYAERDRVVPPGSSFATVHNARFGLLDTTLLPKPSWFALRTWTATADPLPTVSPSPAQTVAPSPSPSPSLSPTASPSRTRTPSKTKPWCRRSASGCTTIIRPAAGAVSPRPRRR